MTDEECVREVIVSGTKKQVSPLCRVCKVKTRIIKERPGLPREVLSKMLGERDANDLLRSKDRTVKSPEPLPSVRDLGQITAVASVPIKKTVKVKANGNGSSEPQAQTERRLIDIPKLIADAGGTTKPPAEELIKMARTGTGKYLCDKYPDIGPINHQFCGRRTSFGEGDHFVQCRECPVRGGALKYFAAIKEEAVSVVEKMSSASLAPTGAAENISHTNKTTENINDIDKEGTVENARANGKKACTEAGCTITAVKDGLCWKHFHAKNGVPPYSSYPSKDAKTKVKQKVEHSSQTKRSTSSVKSRQHVGNAPANKRCKAPGCTKYRVIDGLCTSHHNEAAQAAANKTTGVTEKLTGNKGASSEYSDLIIANANSALINLGYKRMLAKQAVDAVCSASGQDLQTIISEAIKYLSNGHAPHESLSPTREGVVKAGRYKKNGHGKSVHGLPLVPTNGNGKMIVTVDFSRYPDLYNVLMDLSRKEIRQPEDQIMAMVADWKGIENKVSA
ncbi:MAG: RuvA C-terminal domain-containing protein [Dissulfurispiraceae bacterium]